MVDPELLVHLAKHGMETEVGQFLNALANKEPHRSAPTDSDISSARDYVIGCSIDPGIRFDELLSSRMGCERPPVPELTVFYQSGGRRIFVGAQVAELCPALVEYCQWLDQDPRVRDQSAPPLPASLR